MKEDSEYPVLTDLIEKGDEIQLSDLGLEEEELVVEGEPGESAETEAPDDPGDIDPAVTAALEQSIRRILDEHMELAMQEIKLVIQQELKKRD